LLLPQSIDECDELSNIYWLNRPFIGDGQLLDHSHMRDFVMGAAALGCFAHDSMFTANCLDIAMSGIEIQEILITPAKVKAAMQGT
jgi:hypothetical protein